MKRLMKVVIFILSITMAWGVVSADGQAAKKVTLSPKKLTVTVGQSKKLKLKNNKKKVTWKVTSGKKNITLKSKKKTGVTVVGKKKGAAKITAKIGKKKYSCKVTVKAKTSKTSTAKEKLSPKQLHQADIAALNQIIYEQRTRGVSIAFYDYDEEDEKDYDFYYYDEEYKGYIVKDRIGYDLVWDSEDNGRLIGIIWNSDVYHSYQFRGSISFSKLTALKYIDCYNNGITSLDVRNLSKLQYLNCGYNQISSLNLTGCSSLSKLTCDQRVSVTGYKGKTERLVDIPGSHASDMAALKKIAKQQNLLGADFSEDETVWNNADIWSRDGKKRLIKINWNDLRGDIDFSEFTALETMEVSGSYLRSINVSGCKVLTSLTCRKASVRSVTASNLTLLKTVVTEEDSLEDLNLSGCISLKYLRYSRNLKSLNVSGCTALNEMYAEGDGDMDRNYFTGFKEMNLETLDVTNCTALTNLSCRFTKNLKDLKLTGCTALGTLICDDNKALSTLDLTGCTSLGKLVCNDNPSLTTININSSKATLGYVECKNNRLLSSLDISGCKALKELTCNNNPMSELNLSACVSLQTLNCDDNLLETLDITNCTRIKTLSCNNNSLASLDITGCLALEELYCNENALTELDVSQCIVLNKLECYHNRLTSLDLSNCLNPGHVACDKGVAVTGISAGSITRHEPFDMPDDPSPSPGDSSDLSDAVILRKIIEQQISLGADVSEDLYDSYQYIWDEDELIMIDWTEANLQGDISFSDFASLEGLYCGGNPSMTSLEVTDCPALEELECNDSGLETLELKGCGALCWLYCENNALSSLDLSDCEELDYVSCDEWVSIIGYDGEVDYY